MLKYSQRCFPPNFLCPLLSLPGLLPPAPADQAAVLRNSPEERRYQESNSLLLSFVVRETCKPACRTREVLPAPETRKIWGVGGEGRKEQWRDLGAGVLPPLW